MLLKRFGRCVKSEMSRYGRTGHNAALAELHGCEFWTADKVFHDAVKSMLSFVRYLPDYS